jgi:hypothetical protein
MEVLRIIEIGLPLIEKIQRPGRPTNGGDIAGRVTRLEDAVEDLSSRVEEITRRLERRGGLLRPGSATPTAADADGLIPTVAHIQTLVAAGNFEGVGRLIAAAEADYEAAQAQLDRLPAGAARTKYEQRLAHLRDFLVRTGRMGK